MRCVIGVLLLVTTGLLAGCSSTNDVVGNGLLQKRKYRPGWHWDVGRSTERVHKESAAAREPMVRLSTRPLERAVEPPLMAELSSAIRPSTPSAPSGGTAPVFRWSGTPSVKMLNRTTVDQEQRAGQTTTGEPRRWNRMALVSGAFLLLSLLVIIAGGGYFLGYVMTFSFLTGLIGLLLCIKHKERGKGIAIAAMAFPVALLAAVIIALNSAW
ncbi:MAG: hypothetical protein JNM62_14240 [Flavobacteriales bacterium]|nr:hypothetical protein [Flavobacteriales bacterium]